MNKTLTRTALAIAAVGLLTGACTTTGNVERNAAGGAALGAIAGAFVLYMIVSGKLAGHQLATAGLGQNGWGAGYLGEYGMTAAFLFEAVATFLFLVVILGATQKGAPSCELSGGCPFGPDRRS